ncbi:MAG: ankyrin repeat domain-containing protein [Gammaproteobacteria bacterium]|nr:ankyrin repeat domain-containing protein [Gammaproteobacteria bacterium]
MSQQLIDKCAEGDVSAVKALVDKGADVNHRGTHGNTPLGYSAYNGHDEIVRFLLDVGADPNIAAFDGWSPLALAVYECRARLVKLLLESGADPHFVHGDSGENLLHVAVAKSDQGAGTTQCVALLLRAGVDPNGKTKQGVETDSFYNVTVYSETPLHWAAAYGDEATVKMLIDAGAEVSIKDGRGDTPLVWAGRHRRPTAIRSLLSIVS